MDSALFETIVLEIVTNLDTRFLVIPLRSEIIGDVRGTIKLFHMDLFPKWGEVDVMFMEGAGKYRLADSLPIRDLFWNAPRGAIFAELIPSATNTVELARLNIAGATGANVVSNHEVRQNPAESTPSQRRRRLAKGRSTPNLGNSIDRKSDLDRRVVDGTHGHGSKPEVVDRQLRTMKRGIYERGSPSDAGQNQVHAECAPVDVRKPVTEKICDDSGNPALGHIEPETGVFTNNHSIRKSTFDVEPTTRPASCGRPENGEHLQLRKASLPEPCQLSSPPLLEDHEIALPPQEPVEKDALSNGARVLFTGELNTTDVARSETGHPIAKNSPAESGLGNPQSAETWTGSQNRIASGRQADLIEVVLSTPKRKVPSGGSSNPNGVSEEVKTKSRETESGNSGNSDETSREDEDSDDEVPELPGDYKSSGSDGSSAESEGEKGRKPVSPREGSVGKDSDQTSSDGDSSQPSSVVSESENIESSSYDSEESDQTPPTGRKMDFTTPKDGSCAARNIGRRSLGGSKHPKHQRLLENESGSHELINLSHQKSIVISGSQQELQPSAGVQHSLAPLSLADDNHLKDLVRGKKVRDLNAKCRISDVQVITTSEAVEKKKDTQPTQENVTVRRSVRQKEKRTVASVQDGKNGEERLEGRSWPPTSVKVGEGSLLLSVREELIPSGEGITEKGLESAEEPSPQASSGYSRKIREALQLARMSATNGADEKEELKRLETPGKERMRRKKGISIPVEAIAVTQSRAAHEERSQQKEPHVRGESVDLLPEGDDQRLEADPLLSPDEIVAVADGLGKVLPASEARQGINKLGSATADENQIDATGKVASDADVGRKKQRERSHKVCQSNTEVTQQDIRGYMTSVPSQGLDRPKTVINEAGNKETSGKSPKKRKLATDLVAIENVVLGLQQVVGPESLNKDAREGAEEKKAGPLDSRWVCTICDPAKSYTKKCSLTRHLLRVHNLEKDDIPSELLQQVELQEGSAIGGKRLEDAEAPNLGFEDLSQRAFIDDEGRRVTGLKEFGTRESEVQLKGEPTQGERRRRKLSVEFSEDPSRLKKLRKSKKDLVTDKVVQVQETEAEEREPLVLEEKHSNTDEENEADERTAGMNEKKDRKRGRKSSKSSKKVRNLEAPLMMDETIGRGGRQAEDVIIPFESVSVEPAEADLPRELPENLQGQKKRKKSNNLDLSVEGRNSGGHQVEFVDHINHTATQESLEVLTTENLLDGNAKEGDKKSQKEKLQQLGFLRDVGGSLGKMKDSNSKKSGNGKFAKTQQITFSGANLPEKSKAKKSAEGRTGDSSKRKAEAPTRPAESAKPVCCPHGCGKNWSKKSSAYFRHIKACPSVPGPYIV